MDLPKIGGWDHRMVIENGIIGIREVYYDRDTGEPIGWTDNEAVVASTVEELVGLHTLMGTALGKPLLMEEDDGEISKLIEYPESEPAKLFPRFAVTGESFTVEGRGQMHIAKLIEPCRRADLRSLIGQSIGGRHIASVESWCMDPLPVGARIGMLVRP